MAGFIRPSHRSRNDGKPWVAWHRGNEYVNTLPDHRERVCLEAWYDRRQGDLVLVVTQYDESMTVSSPCWAQLRLSHTGDLLARDEALSAAALWLKTVAESFVLPGPFPLTEVGTVNLLADLAGVDDHEGTPAT